MSTRRSIVEGMAGLGLMTAWGCHATAAARRSTPPAEAGLSEAAVSSAEWVTLPGKVPLIKRTFRPPNLETPAEYFRDPITPNKAFFVRYHHSQIPEIDRNSWVLNLGGAAAAAGAQFTLQQLRSGFEQVEVTALCLCSGNRRGLFSPHVAGVQWGSGAMGNARWRGVRLRDVLAKAGLNADALEVAFDGEDGPVFPAAPDYQKSLPLDKALDADTLIALEMNGQPLPQPHGAPARLVVPGWTATYWIKHLRSIEVRNAPFDNFWMKTGYRIPLGKFPGMRSFASQENSTNTPITEIIVNSIITSPLPASRVGRGRVVEVRGMAWDAGHGLQSVDVSTDRGVSWETAVLGRNLGRYSMRSWSHRITAPGQIGELKVWARATSANGTAQPLEAVANPSGYHHNRIQMLDLVVA